MVSQNSTIFVNATALSSGGGLSILRQFIEGLDAFDQRNSYYIFTCRDDLVAKSATIHFIHVATNRWVKRLWWDYYGCRRWADSNLLQPDMVISLQNTGIRFSGLRQLIYYHQPLPLSRHTWKFYKKSERLLFFYNKVFPWFVRGSIDKNCSFVVQLNSIKELFCERFGIDSERVRVLRPAPPAISVSDVRKVTLEKEKVHLVYPATAVPYKNHGVVIRALRRLKEDNREVFDALVVHFTIDQSSGGSVVALAKKMDVSEVISFHGSLSFENVLSLYKCGDALLFPSFIETFGLPLFEAAAFGLKILAADMPYSREVLDGYAGVSFLPYDDPEAWATAIVRVQSGVRFEPLRRTTQNPWESFLEVTQRILEARL